MHELKGPRQPISSNPNGIPSYISNPMEDIPVEEFAPWEDNNNVAEYINEPVFSSQVYGISSKHIKNH